MQDTARQAEAQAPGQAAPAGQPAPVQGSRRRPRRRAASAQGSNASIETVTASAAGVAQPGAQHVARAGKPAAREETGGDEPMILGVGVPASDL